MTVGASEELAPTWDAGTLTLACGDYDRTRPLLDGRVTIEGADVNVQLRSVQDLLAGAARLEFDVVEHSLSTIVMQHGPSAPYVALPIFPSRMFRHNGIYVRADSELRDPSELRGCRVGITGYTVTGMVWIRGMLADLYDLPIDGVVYVNGGVDRPGAPPMRGAIAPPGVVVEEAGSDVTLADLLVSGEIDAIYSLHTPSGFSRTPRSIRRLFADVRGEERRYFERTAIFPLMHVLAVRREVLASHPGIGASLATAFERANALAAAGLDDTGALRVMLPWSYCDMEEARELMAGGFWADGIDANRANLATFVRYAHEQGLVAAPVDLDELFPTTLD